jgi:hypothetical protein
MNICPVGDELLHAKGETADGRQTDRRDKANGHFSKFYESAKKIKLNKLFHVDRYPSIQVSKSRLNCESSVPVVER